LFRFTDTAGYDGGACKADVEILFGLLQRWGDENFAGMLSAQPSHIRHVVVNEIRMTFPEQSNQFPKTYSLAPH
jgi:hypothetical protein